MRNVTFRQRLTLYYRLRRRCVSIASFCSRLPITFGTTKPLLPNDIITVFGAFIWGLVFHCVCDVTGICDAKMVIMLRPVLPNMEELNFIMADLGTSCLQETL